MTKLAGRTFTLRSQRRATWFTPIAVILLVWLASSEATDLQREPYGVSWVLVSIAIMAVALAATIDCLERLVSMPPRTAHWSRLVMLTLVTLLLSSALFGPFTQGTSRWAAIITGVAWAATLWLTLREVTRLLRSRASRSDGTTTVSATAS